MLLIIRFPEIEVALRLLEKRNGIKIAERALYERGAIPGCSHRRNNHRSGDDWALVDMPLPPATNISLVIRHERFFLHIDITLAIA